MPACLPSIYLFMGALFLFCPGSGNLAGAVEDGRSAETGERGGERSFGGGGGGRCDLTPNFDSS